MGEFDRFMVALDAPANPKVKRLKRAGKEVRWAWFHGVLPIAAKANLRGAFCVGDTPADEHDVADVADVTLAEARKALAVARELKMLDRDEHGIEWVHDFEVYNPEPKRDSTAAERAKRYREKQREKRDVTASSRRDASRDVTRDGRDANGSVTPPEVEGEVEVSSLRSEGARAGGEKSKRRRPEPVDQDALPADLPERLHAVADQVMAVLARVAAAKGAKPVTRAAVGRAVAAYPDHNHVRIVGEFEHYWVHGAGTGVTRADIVQTYRRRLDQLPADPAAALGAAAGRLQVVPSVQQARTSAAAFVAAQERALGTRDGGAA